MGNKCEFTVVRSSSFVTDEDQSCQMTYTLFTNFTSEKYFLYQIL